MNLFPMILFTNEADNNISEITWSLLRISSVICTNFIPYIISVLNRVDRYASYDGSKKINMVYT